MECRNARALQDDYLEGALDGVTRSRVEAHLGTCELCRREFDEAARYREALSGLPRVKVPDDFLGGIHDRLAADSARKKRWEFYSRPLWKTIPFGAAAAAVAVFALIVVFHNQKPKYERPAEQGTVRELQPRGEGKKETAEIPRSTSQKAAREVEDVEARGAPMSSGGEVEEAEPAAAPSAPKDVGGSGTLDTTPVTITLVLERPGAIEQRQKEEPARSARLKAQNAAPGAQPGEMADRRAGGETPGAIAGPSLGGLSIDRAREALASIITEAIMESGGRTVGTEAAAAADDVPGDAPGKPLLTVVAEIPAHEVAGLLERLELLGQIQTESALSLVPSASMGESVELRIRLTYRSPEDSGPRRFPD